MTKNRWNDAARAASLAVRLARALYGTPVRPKGIVGARPSAPISPRTVAAARPATAPRSVYGGTIIQPVALPGQPQRTFGRKR